jgi:sugar lactone lactonase YvrE
MIARKHRLTLLVAGLVALASVITPHRASADALFVANAGNNTIGQFTPDGVGSVFASSGLNSPHGLAFDSAGNLYAANAGNNTIEKFTPGGVGSLFASTGLSGPSGLAFDSGDNLYVAIISTARSRGSRRPASARSSPTRAPA